MESNALGSRLASIRTRLASAANRSGRNTDSISIVAVSKTVSIEQVEAAYHLGLVNFGENYVQEFLSKWNARISIDSKLFWHFIGHLQTNKVREVVGKVELIHSVDTLNLASEIGKHSIRMGLTSRVLVQVKLDPTDTKFGVEPEQTPYFVDQVRIGTGLFGHRLAQTI